MGDIWYLDEVFPSTGGKRQYLWRADDQDEVIIDILMQSRRNNGAARRFSSQLLKRQAYAPWMIISEKLRSFPAALHEIMSSLTHITDQYENNRAEYCGTEHLSRSGRRLIEIQLDIQYY